MVDNLKWNGLAKKSGFELDDLISEIKVENLDRPNKQIIYPIALFLLFLLNNLSCLFSLTSNICEANSSLDLIIFLVIL